MRKKDGENISASCSTFFWIIMKSTLIQRVLFVALIPHLYYLAKIYIEVIL